MLAAQVADDSVQAHPGSILSIVTRPHEGAAYHRFTMSAETTTTAHASKVVTNGGTRPENTWVYFNGDIVRYHDVHLGLMTHALHYGTGCFEGIRAYWNEQRGQLFLLQAAPHYDRLRRSGRILRMDLPHDTETLINITLDLLRRNEYRSDVYIRPLLFKSSEEIGVRLHGVPETLAIYTTPFGKYVETEGGIRCMTSSWRRVSDQSAPARAKISGSYINSALAKSEANESGFDEAIVLTLEGHVSEGSAENLFMIAGGVAYTPPVTDDILEGITRKLMIQVLTEDIGMRVVERSIDRTELYTCDELFLCGTGAQVSPVVELDHRTIGDGRVGEISQEVQQIYFASVRGESPAHSDWSIPV
jgi:branched-chain amino acid aminotransferase